MKLNTLSPIEGTKHSRKRVGRGIGSGLGKTSARGHKGQKARSGGYTKVGFEGGQMPLQRRLPKFGFTSRVGRKIAQVRTQELNSVQAEVIDLAALKQAGLVRKDMTSVRIMASGELQKPVTVSRFVYCTKGAKQAIEQAGGKIE